MVSILLFLLIETQTYFFPDESIRLEQIKYVAPLGLTFGLSLLVTSLILLAMRRRLWIIPSVFCCAFNLSVAGLYILHPEPLWPFSTSNSYNFGLYYLAGNVLVGGLLLLFMLIGEAELRRKARGRSSAE